jgi:hypothetical protein
MDRTKEAFEVFHELNKDLEQSDYIELLERTFGKPPYEFLDEGQIPKYSVHRVKSLTLSPEYKSRNPQPNYYNFGKPEFIDTKGRLYKIATGPFRNQYIESGDITDPFTKTSQYEKEYHGFQVLWAKLPIPNKGVEFPDAQSNEKLVLYDIKSMTKCTAVVDSSFFEARRKTGTVMVRDFISYGTETDVHEFNKLMKG